MELFLCNTLLCIFFLLVISCANVEAADQYGHGKFITRSVHGLNHMKKKAETIFGPSYGIDKLNRTSFPKGFLFGAASSAYQIEGAWNVDGKGPSNWDYFTHKYPEKIADGNNGDVAADSYHRYKKDIALLKGINMDSYRFSIAWSRILPSGKLSGGVNEKGIEYYNDLISYLLANGITPIVTLFHWDVPQALEEEYGGFLSNKIVRDFCDYANICFERFGDRVKHWITLNEPSTYSIGGYESGSSAPGRCSSWMNKNCTAGISGNELYIVTHTQILAHAAAVQLYKTKYQAEQKGVIGITVVSMWMEPLSNSSADRQSAIRQLDFMLGWLMNPIVYGDYPDSMRRLVGSRLPKFTTEEAKQVKGSYDFIGLNYYSALYVSDATATSNPSNLTSYFTDSKTNLAVARNGKLIGEQTASNWFYVYPQGIHKLLIYTKKTYKDPVIYITENGVAEANNATLPLELALKDNFRIKYYYLHLSNLLKAIKDGVRVKGYYGWSIMDNFEWSSGYTFRFGIHYVDFKNGLRRYPKLSAKWFGRFLMK